jgi:hypothetical protein
MKIISILSTVTLAICMNACSPSIDMPKGSVKGYNSARLIKRDSTDTNLSAKEKTVHRMIQKSINNQFTRHGKSFGNANADLIAAYLVIFQNNGMTTSYNEYFGYGRDVDHIVDVAHMKGVIKEVRPDSFERAGLLVDIIDAKSNKLVYRNIFVGDIVRGGSDAQRSQRINAAVNQALSPFFAK